MSALVHCWLLCASGGSGRDAYSLLRVVLSSRDCQCDGSSLVPLGGHVFGALAKVARNLPASLVECGFCEA
jgi:hypothetical protein